MSIDGSTYRHSILVEFDLGMVQGIGVTLVGMSCCQRKHDGGNLMAYIGEVFASHIFGDFTATGQRGQLLGGIGFVGTG